MLRLTWNAKCSEGKMGLARGTIMVAVLGCVCLALPSCKREDRGFRVSPPAVSTAYLPVTSDLHAGGATTQPARPNPYDENAHAMSEGKQLFSNYNCSGCHANGGGGMGPPLIDDKWIYGSDPDQIFATIIQGRPNGMPSFRGKIPDNQVWQLAAYVRSLGGLAQTDAAPGRDDHMQTKPAENSMPPQTPTNSSESPSVEMP
jgi:cytochrome c oxidase cbb3-type subunit III